LINYENILAYDYRRTLCNWIEAGQIDCCQTTVTPVLIVRDLLNWWASYLTFVPEVSRINHQNLFDVWVSHVKEAFGETDYITHKEVVNYDHFNSGKCQREYLCHRLGGEYTEARIDQVLEAGRGSSFDGQSVPGRKMKTDLRYHQMTGHDYYWEMLADNPEAVALYQKHFKLTDDQKQILKAL